jgi:hypothetical protein
MSTLTEELVLLISVYILIKQQGVIDVRQMIKSANDQEKEN